MYKIVLDPVEFFAETTNRTHPVYMEALEKVQGKSAGAMGHIKRFVSAIKKKYKHQDKDIVGSKGNINSYKHHDEIEKAFAMLKKYHAGSSTVQNLEKIHSALHKNADIYQDGYRKYVDLVTIEYEMGLTTLVRGLEYQLSASLNIEEKNGSFILSKKAPESNETLDQLISSFAKELNDSAHVQFIEALVKAKDEFKVDTNVNEVVTFEESSVSEVVSLINSIVTNTGNVVKNIIGGAKALAKSAFGILVILRACTYYFYQRKADKIMKLQEQIQFLEINVEQLKNRSNIDPNKKEEIIKKQRAVIENYQKKAAKLLAQLQDNSRETSSMLKEDAPEIKKNEVEDEFQL
jgi:MoaA/NifB/PqqE/SkfB family radical SAM enzyme|nr:MAG TPA: hypothetical protein [Caudoviricetes sp.]